MLPTSNRFTVVNARRVPADISAVAILISEETKAIPAAAPISAAVRSAADQLLSATLSRGKAREVSVAAAAGGSKSSPQRVVLVGLGKSAKISVESLRDAGAAVARAARRHRLKSVALLAPEAGGLDLQSVPAGDAAEALSLGFLLAGFSYEEYKGSARKKEEAEKIGAAQLVLVGAESSASIERARIIAEAQNFARTIASRPGNDINPPSLAVVAKRLAAEVGLECRILDERQMARLGMGGMLGVGAGSSAPPRMIILRHTPQARGSARRGIGAASPLLVVGKAITFDTGGISIKPADRMGRMIFDKCGGMAVLGLMCAAARLKLPVPIVGILAAAENHISGNAYRPGDILRMYNGVTVEVTNTDAEGRLVLGDALSWGIETYKPAAVIDLATLTGGIVIALGRGIAGLMSNNDGIVAEIQAAGGRSGEKLWRMPLGEEQREQIKSDAADIVNAAGRDAHPLQGGAFLSHFVPETLPWAHLDIAGVADTDKELPLYAKGATGWGVRTLLAWVEARI